MALKALVCAALALGSMAALARPPHVAADKTVGGFVFPESVGCDAKNKVLYVGNFGGQKLAPAEKDRLGYISKVGLDGKVLEQKFLPGPGGEALSKPKGIWVRGDRLWVTDIDVVWVFDLKTRKGRKVALPGVTFANDPAVAGNTLYISDNRSDQLVKVEPADFLNAKGAPKVTTLMKGAGVNPNGLWPASDGRLYMVGFLAPDKPRSVYVFGVSGQVRPVTDPIGRLDGVYERADGSLLYTDWNSGSLSYWSEGDGKHPLALGFKGPADFCVLPSKGGMTVFVPDLVQSQLRIIELR
jgi:hypothetical protein